MSAPTDTNRLDSAGSPYLRQHADNPVHWQPWDDAALAAANERDVPIFLSIGYSACHWCHVMEEESFEDPEIAEALNGSFVPIKVDREERPDLDQIYQTICQLVSGGGGWPLSVWLTPDGKPFYVGTYFPKESTGQRPGFRQLLEDIAASWSDPEQRAEIESRADQWTDAITSEVESTPDVPDDVDQDPPGEELLETAVRAALRSADNEYGGFGGGNGPKFPQARRLELLLTAATAGNDNAVAIATRSLDAMASGGLYDHLGGGFHRYTVDRKWTVPHFEKMLYDNAELPRVYLSAYQYTGTERYADTVRETLQFVDRELRDDGGFYSTLDAQSGGAEGTFYVWTPSQVHEVLDDAEAELFCDRFGVTKQGNFEKATTVLNITASIDDLAAEYDLQPEEIRSRLDAAKNALFEARSDRERPRRDEKVLAGWNGLMISAFARAGRVLDTSFAGTATEALSAVRSALWDESDGRLRRRVIDGEVAGEGYLEDYAFLGRAAFDLYQATGEVEPLVFAIDLAETIVDEFYDEERGTLYFTPESGEALVSRPQEFYDQSTPSSLGVAVRLLVQLDGFRTDRRFAEIADDVLATHSNRIDTQPLEHVSLTLAAIERARGGTELTIAAEEMPESWRETLARRYIPGMVLAQRPADEAALEEWLAVVGLGEAPPAWADRGACDNEPTVYACRSFTCSPPKHDLEEALSWLTER